MQVGAGAVQGAWGHGCPRSGAPAAAGCAGTAGATGPVQVLRGRGGRCPAQRPLPKVTSLHMHLPGRALLLQIISEKKKKKKLPSQFRGKCVFIDLLFKQLLVSCYKRTLPARGQHVDICWAAGMCGACSMDWGCTALHSHAVKESDKLVIDQDDATVCM